MELSNGQRVIILLSLFSAWNCDPILHSNRTIPPSSDSLFQNRNKRPALAASSDNLPGRIGVDRNLDYQCTFWLNSTYTCKRDCKEETFQASFPDRPYMKYTERNCSTDVPVEGGIIPKRWSSNTANQIIATCSFYKTLWYECYGVADCSRGEGITMCAGAAPWRGAYQGSPGSFQGNITAEAQNSPPMQPPSVNGGNNIGPVLKKKAVASCEKFVDSSAACYAFDRTCFGPPERQTCSYARKFIPNSQTYSDYYSKFDAVILSIEESSLLAAGDVVANCYFYDNNEYNCGFPFPATFKADSSPLRQTTGSYYKGLS